ncbi:sigma-70 family RNA polymerase sigma factor [Duganella sp. FT80W]|uniref:Sigma-70 family RNA polymerase sigma factor n=1 Tax=Duganella guangzhouensis TaxID=2666084 RepID=A0A6I2L7A5_9BURK|nr:sigma-70 family RNA polymerase sigma factor [Duganella guangzhouensis]MRW93107.1 sigma-70 family RNA polymerase sigma factor [Duganella guangzhouensis]
MDAFEQLRPRLKAISLRIVGSEAEAEDVVQDCFFKWRVAEQAALLTPAAWLTTVVQHQSIDRLRQRAREALALQAAAGGEGVPIALAAQPEDALLRRAEVAEALACLLACLSPAERLALVLHEVLECDHADIAAALGITVANARQHLSRARRRLRERAAEALREEKLNRELVRRFQAAINSRDVPAVVTLLTDAQPLAVCANDACYALAA